MKKSIKTTRALSFLFALIIVLSTFSGCNAIFDGVVEPLASAVREADGDTSGNYLNSEGKESKLSSTPEMSSPRNNIDLGNIPKFNTSACIEINGNKPFFTKDDYTTSSYEYYSDLDALGRCGVCYACIGKSIMPTEERGAIGMVKPSGWHTVKYDCVDGKYLYNRCHLIGYQLAGENANEKNLITGTRYLNVVGMLPYENEVADYVNKTDNHVMYRVTPIYEGDNLVANGVLMEGYSVEDRGQGVCFNIYCYNAQPGVTIDYKTGDSKLEK